MYELDGAALDLHITGNYGQDACSDECENHECPDRDDCPHDLDFESCLADGELLREDWGTDR